MAHRKHLSQEGHAESEKKHKKAATQHPHTAKKEGQLGNQEHNKQKNANKSNYSNSHIKDEHGEY